MFASGRLLEALCVVPRSKSGRGSREAGAAFFPIKEGCREGFLGKYNITSSNKIYRYIYILYTIVG